MYAKTITIKNRTGLHARPASEFVRCAGTFTSRITIGKTGSEDRANAKSIVMLLSLCLVQGTEVEISAKGDDEQQAVNALVALIESFED